LIYWAKKHKTFTFHLEESTNSGEILGEPDAETTSYVLGWYEKGKNGVTKIDKKRYEYWVSVGAQPSLVIEKLLK